MDSHDMFMIDDDNFNDEKMRDDNDDGNKMKKNNSFNPNDYE